VTQTASLPTLGIIGPVRLAYGITAEGALHRALAGGSALYAAAGARVWTRQVEVMARATRSTQEALAPALAASGIDASHLRLIPGDEVDLEFHSTGPAGEVEEGSPSPHFLRHGHLLPKELLGFRPAQRAPLLEEPPGDLAVRPDDLRAARCHWQAAHLTPVEYFSQATLPGALHELGTRQVSLDPTPRLMDPASRTELATVLRSLHAFLPSEEEVLALHRPRRPDLWECAEELSAMGPWIVVIKRSLLGALVWDSESRSRWTVPAYPAAERDRFGVGDAFCGGFAAGLTMADEPVRAALRGAVSASLAIEGFGALYPLGATPGLAEARLEALQDAVRRA